MFTDELSNALHDLLRREDFAPIDVVVADGRVVKINHREQAWIEAGSELLYVASLKQSDSPLTEIVALRNVAMIRVRAELAPKTPDDRPF